MFVQRHADTPQHPTFQLGERPIRVNDDSGIDDDRDFLQFNFSGRSIYFHMGGCRNPGRHGALLSEGQGHANPFISR
ncbi:hypothetical protein D3C85_908230 [compost metagenome]